MLYTFVFYFVLFMIYSFAGWLLEVGVFLVEDKKFVNRGFLIGPYCPIYGSSSIVMIFALHKYVHDPIVLFILAAVLCTFIEYVTSYVMEKLFKARWWDYSTKSFNINGRVCLGNSVVFGILGCLLVYFINPHVSEWLSLIPEQIFIPIGLALFALFIADNITSLNIISRFKSTANTLLKDSTEEITEKVKEILKNRSALTRRLMNAFPDLKAKIPDFKARIKEKIHK